MSHRGECGIDEKPGAGSAINVEGTANVLAGAKARGWNVSCLYTGGGIYGESDGADETTLPRTKSYSCPTL